MTRELKFRAWDTQYSEYKSDWLVPYEQLLRLNEPDSKMVYEQFTGLKDENGTDIYEGDILRLNGVENVTVYYADSAAMFCIAHEGEDIDTPEEPLWEAILMAITTSRVPEVIGNVHENPELLEGSE